MNTDYRTLLGIAVGGLGSVGAALALVGVRGELLNANVALILVVFVLLGAIVGGRSAGAMSALAAAIAFDFFHTKPYNNLRIANGNEIVTTVLLFVVGLAVGEVAARAERIRGLLAADRHELRRVHRIAELAANGEGAEDLILSVTAELMGLLKLKDCYFEWAPFIASLPTIEPSGYVERHEWRWTGEGFELPSSGVQVPVVSGGKTVGRFVLVPTPGVGVRPEARMIAVALADHVGVVVSKRAA